MFALVAGAGLCARAGDAIVHAAANAGGTHSIQRPANNSSVLKSYAGSQICRGCHAQEFKLWSASHHALAERPVRTNLDLRAFVPPREMGRGAQRSAVQWRDGRARIASVGLSHKLETNTVVGVIGVSPLRQFLVAVPGGRRQVLAAAYDPRSNQWFNVFGKENRKPGEWGDWTGRGMNWNSMCAECHNTRLRKNYDPATDSYHTTMAERGVGCEACHGPMAAHVAWQKKYGKSGRADPTLPRFTREQTMENCAFCHSRRADLTGDFKPGDKFCDDQDLAIVDESDHFYPDGQVHAEDYEFSAFDGSAMRSQGVICTDCHNPHSLKTLLPGNWLCMRCHDGSYKHAPVIKPVQHSHHWVFGYSTNGAATNFDLTIYRTAAIKDTGGECVNCHMPQTVYMQRHWRHDHGFTIPDPLLTKQFGVPNACNRCHKDKDADWALNWVVKWYGKKMDRPTRTRAQIIARARNGDGSSRAGLLGLLQTETIPYWRAVAAGLLGQWAAQKEVTPALLQGLNDTNALVRSACVRALEPLVGSETVSNALRKKLSDPTRNVRVAAAWALRASLSGASPAAADLKRYLAVNADQPVGQLQLGLYFSGRGDLDTACKHLQTAVAWDGFSAPLRIELAVVLSALGRKAEAVAQLQTACRNSPQNADAHFSLGLALNEQGDTAGAQKELETAVRMDPHFARAWYDLGLLQNSEGHAQEAVDSLVRAEKADPSDPGIPYARATILARLGRTDEARAVLRRVLESYPDDVQARRLLDLLTQ